MPNNPFGNPFSVPSFQAAHLQVKLPDPNQSLANLMRLQMMQQRMQLAAMRAARAGAGGAGAGAGAGRSGLGKALEVMVPTKKPGEKKSVIVYGHTEKERKEAAQRAINDAVNDIIASDKDLQKDLSDFDSLSVPGKKEALDRVRQQYIPRLAEQTGVSGEELSGRLTGALDKTIKDREKAIAAAGIGTQLADAAGTVFRRGADAIASIFDSSKEKLARGHAAAEAEEKAVRENAFRDEIARMQREGRDTTGFQLRNPFRAGVQHVAPLAAMIAPAIVGGAVAGPAGAMIGGAAGASAMSAAESLERVATDPNLTEAQKEEKIGPTQALSAGISGALGAVPVGPTALMRPAAKLAMGAAPFKMLPGATAAETKAVGQRWLAERAAAAKPNIFREVPKHAVDAAALGGAFQVGSNIAYGAGTGQDVPLTEGLGNAIAAGAVLGVPFGAFARMRQRQPAMLDSDLRSLVSMGVVHPDKRVVARPRIEPRYDPPVQPVPKGPWEAPELPRTLYPEPVRSGPERVEPEVAPDDPWRAVYNRPLQAVREWPDPLREMWQQERAAEAVPEPRKWQQFLLNSPTPQVIEKRFAALKGTVQGYKDAKDLFTEALNRGLLSEQQAEAILGRYNQKATYVKGGNAALTLFRKSRIGMEENTPPVAPVQSLADRWLAQMEAEWGRPLTAEERAGIELLAGSVEAEQNGNRGADTTGGAGEPVAGLEPVRPAGEGRTDTENPAPDSTVPGNTTPDVAAVADAPAEEAASSRPATEGRGDDGTPPSDTGEIEAVTGTPAGAESADGESDFGAAANANAEGSAGQRGAQPKARVRPTNADAARTTLEQNGPALEEPLPGASQEEVHAVNRENAAETPVEIRIQPGDDDAAVQAKLTAQLVNAGRGDLAADEAALLLRLGQTMGGLTGRSPAEELRSVIFSFNENLESQVGKALTLAARHEQEAWHGTPNEIVGPLSTDYLGSGEGAQIHGWGIYVALDENIARERYQYRLSPSPYLKELTINGEPIRQIYDDSMTLYTYYSAPKFKVFNSETGKWEKYNPMGADYKYLNISEESLRRIFDTAQGLEERHNKYYYDDFGAPPAPSKDTIIDSLEIHAREARRIFEFYRQRADQPSASRSAKADVKEAETELKHAEAAVEAAQKLSYEMGGAGERLRLRIPDDDVMLREDALFSEQPAFVQKKLQALIRDTKFDIPIADLTGREIYEKLSAQFDPDIHIGSKNASLLLLRHGIKGIRYEGGIDGECAVLFDGADAKILEKFYDQNGGRGRIDLYSDGTANIIFGNSADASTAIHEFEHFTIERLGQMLRNGEIVSEGKRAQVMKDLERLSKWGGMKEDATADVRAWSPKVHEKIARGFEAYLREGKAPAPELEGIFARLKEMLITLYQRARQLIGADKLPQDIREIFDRQLTGYKEPAPVQTPKPKAKSAPKPAPKPVPKPTEPRYDTSKPFDDATYESVRKSLRDRLILQQQKAHPVERYRLSEQEATEHVDNEDWYTIRTVLKNNRNYDLNLDAVLARLEEYADKKNEALFSGKEKRQIYDMDDLEYLDENPATTAENIEERLRDLSEIKRTTITQTKEVIIPEGESAALLKEVDNRVATQKQQYRKLLNEATSPKAVAQLPKKALAELDKDIRENNYGNAKEWAEEEFGDWRNDPEAREELINRAQSPTMIREALEDGADPYEVRTDILYGRKLLGKSPYDAEVDALFHEYFSDEFTPEQARRLVREDLDDVVKSILEKGNPLKKAEAVKPESEPISQELNEVRDTELLNSLTSEPAAPTENPEPAKGVYTKELTNLRRQISRKFDKIFPGKTKTKELTSQVENAFLKSALGEKLTPAEKKAYNAALAAKIKPLMVNKTAVEQAVQQSKDRGFTDSKSEELKADPAKSAADILDKEGC